MLLAAVARLLLFFLFFLGDVSQVTTMDHLFNSAKVFNKDISKWVTSKVKIMTQTFKQANAFNQDLSKWDVSQVINMKR